MKSTLDKIRDEHKGNVPPVPYLPSGEVVIVYRLPSEEMTPGGLYTPDEYQTPVSKGILVAAGLKARDIMADALIEMGDIVYFARFAGDEREFKREAWVDRWQPELPPRCAKCGEYVLEMKYSREHVAWQCLEATCR